MNRRSAYDRDCLARANGRPTAASFIRNVTTEFIEMHGDRRYSDDAAVLAGIARLDGRPVTVIGLEKGVDLQDRMRHNFGSAHPEGYRKALRQMQLAEKFRRPVICFVDTSGAFCGVGAEERGQGQAIAENLMAMSALNTPIITVVIGEGGSGGALALAVADEVWMLENAIYSVISPEGAASILWKDASRTRESSECLKLTARDLKKFGVVERVFREGGDWNKVYGELKSLLTKTLKRYAAMDREALLNHRYEKFRRIGRLSRA